METDPVVLSQLGSLQLRILQFYIIHSLKRVAIMIRVMPLIMYQSRPWLEVLQTDKVELVFMIKKMNKKNKKLSKTQITFKFQFNRLQDLKLKKDLEKVITSSFQKMLISLLQDCQLKNLRRKVFHHHQRKILALEDNTKLTLLPLTKKMLLLIDQNLQLLKNLRTRSLLLALMQF